MFQLITERLILREWKDEDFEALHELCSDPEVMKYFPKIHTEEDTWAMIGRLRERMSQDGFCFFACELKETKETIGILGASKIRFEGPIKNAVEIGWRMRRNFWNKGYSTEGAKEVARFLFDDIGLETIYAFAVPENKPSLKVMTKIGMEYEENMDFIHPDVPENAQYRKHVVYSLTKS